MKSMPHFVIETITITLTRAEAEKALTHPKPLQDFIAVALASVKPGVEHVGAEEQPVAELPPVAGAKRPKKANGRAKPALPCPHCAQSFTAAGWRERHIRTAHPDAAAN